VHRQECQGKYRRNLNAEDRVEHLSIEQMVGPPFEDVGSDNVRETILGAAADCFMAAGYNATSIDDVADRLRATKGMIYHYYRSKAALFFDVHRRGMAINLAAIEPVARAGEDPRTRLEKMCTAHLANMLDHLSFQRVVMQGVEMHLAGSTTPAQREMLAKLMRERQRYEDLFRDVLIEGRDAGQFSFGNASFASKAVLAILNNPVLWYRHRQGDPPDARQKIINEFAAYSMASVCAAESNPEEAP
jgi:AcrR family transcriptional regulator